jgi:DNA-binding XRE family transcriptional regulator
MKNWLWDKKINISTAKKILKKPEHKRFYTLAALLLARSNEPAKVFKEYLNPLVFCEQWSRIKKSMREDTWNEPRIIFWQAIYEKLLNKYRKRGIALRKDVRIVKDPLCAKTGKLIRNTRKEQGLSQKDLAKKLGISQQIISRVEKGRENISLATLTNITRALGVKVEFIFTSK